VEALTDRETPGNIRYSPSSDISGTAIESETLLPSAALATVAVFSWKLNGRPVTCVSADDVSQCGPE
jgi:hypothetical protein